MKVRAAKFGQDMDDIHGYVHVIEAALNVVKTSTKGVRSKHPLTRAAVNLHLRGHKVGHFTVAAYDGAYLTACAAFELVVRELIERYVERCSDKCSTYNHLPKEFRNYYPEGCARLILDVGRDKLKHLSHDAIVKSLASCVKPAKSKKFHLLGEAFSYHERNFWPEEIERCLQYLGIDKVWQKVSREPDLQSSLGTRNDNHTEQVAREKLKGFLQRRNDIVHRGKSYFTPSQSEVIELTSFFKALVKNLAQVMENQFSAV
jgi:hypothetical protein